MASQGSGNLSKRRFPAIVLAAGASRRMGRAKALLPWAKGNLLDQAVGQAWCLGDEVWVVAGCRYPLIRYRCRRQPSGWLRNPEWEEGMASSLRRGLGALPAAAAGAFVVLVDQPLITLESLQPLADHARADPARAVAADYNGRPGAPAWLPRSLWPAISRITGDRGAASVLAAAAAHRVRVPGSELDLDTLEDWRKLSGHQANRPESQAMPTAKMPRLTDRPMV
ncbi:NTP transferase domain-containing protein [Marinobacter sp.]|uniref:nucleotidyltransferase family protein n=1 Tax=Marinobacter sp. TaxID=50741 RepID=UPI00384B870D